MKRLFLSPCESATWFSGLNNLCNSGLITNTHSWVNTASLGVKKNPVAFLAAELKQAQRLRDPIILFKWLVKKIVCLILA